MWLFRFMYRVLLGWGVYFLWSKFYRVLYHDKYEGIRLRGGLGPSDVAQAMSKLRWTKDGGRELGDAIGSPRWVQHCVNAVLTGNKQPPGALDCDEFSVWAATVLDGKYAPQVLNVVWRSGKTVDGHNVCLYVTESGLFRHTGNWGDRGDFASLREAVIDILQAVTKEEKDVVGWATFSPELSLSAWSNSLPK